VLSKPAYPHGARVRCRLDVAVDDSEGMGMLERLGRLHAQVGHVWK